MRPRTFSVQTHDGVKIACTHYVQGHTHALIIAPGFYNSKEAILLKDLGRALNGHFDVIMMDFRGHGNSDGLFHWTSKEHLDLTAVLEYAAKHYSRIGVIGFSLGAATTLITAGKSALIDSIAAVSPPSDFDKIEFRFWELDADIDLKYSLLGEGRIGKGVRPGPFWLPKVKPIESVVNIQQPVFYIHGTADWIIKPWHSQALFNQTTSFKRLELIEDAPHAEYLMLHYNHHLIRLLTEWFTETLF